MGFGHFNNAYAIFNLLLMISTAGLPVAMSKTISEANALGRRNQVNRVFRVALTTFLVLGIVSASIMFFFAQPLAILQGDSLAAPAVQVMAPVGFLPVHHVRLPGLRPGPFQHGPRRSPRSSRRSSSSPWAWPGLVSAQAGLRQRDLRRRRHRRRHRQRLCGPHLFDRPALPAQPPPGRQRRQAGVLKHILKVLASIAIPITLSSSVVPITTYLDTVQVQNLLQSALGYSEEMAVSLYGSYQKAVAIYNLPSSFMVSLTACIVPAISACLTKKDRLGSGKIAESALRVGAMLALPAGVGLAVLAGPIIQLLFPETNQEVASACMRILGIASIFVCIMLLCNAILRPTAGQAAHLVYRHRQRGQAGGELLPGANPSVGIKGAPVDDPGVLCAGGGDGAGCHQAGYPYPPNISGSSLRPPWPPWSWGAAAWAGYGLLASRLGNTLAVAGAIVVGGIVYVVLVLVLRVVSRDDLSLMPKGIRSPSSFGFGKM